MPEEFLHIRKSEIKKDISIFLLIIPAVIFALSLAFFFTKMHKYSSTAFSTKSDTAVLGETSENP
ncbi:MAG TPA: hypothetical protein VJ399_03465 [Patescibacteria group bacterium]|nr:hypothetical protein [Patescibacteria group bacterium]